jgi:hypothetical protein
MSLGFLGNSPIGVSLNNNNFEVSLTETDIGLNPIFNTASVALYDGNINSLTLDKYGRITDISTGYTLPTPNQINHLKITGDVGTTINAEITDLLNSDTVKFTGKTGHISTQIIDKNIISELTVTGITNQDVYTFEVKNTNAVTNGLKIRKLNTETYTTNITLSKGKEYIFRQYNDTSTESGGELSTHAIGVSSTINGVAAYSDGVEYFIKDSQDILLGPLSYIDYNTNFLVRGVTGQPYVKIKLPNDAPTNLYLYSQFTSSNVNGITIDIISEIEYITYNNVNSLVVDSYGRLHTVGQTTNLDDIMSQFNVRADDTNKFIIKNNENLDIVGKSGHIRSYIENNKLFSRLAETDIISTNIDNVDIVVIQTVDVISGNVKWYDPITSSTTFAELNILKGRTFKFIQINPLIQTHGMGISTSQISVVEYITGIEYHVYIGGNDTIVTANDYNNYFTNAGLNGSSAYILFNVPNDAPSKLYMYSRFSSLVTKMELNVIGDFRKIDNILSLTVDRFGRIHDAVSGVDNNRVEFIIEMTGYNTLSFGLIERSLYIQTLIALFTVINYSDVSLSLVDVNNVVRITTSINEISTLKSQSIINNIYNLQNITNTATAFKNALKSSGLSLLIDFNIIQAGLNINIPNTLAFTSFNVNVNNNDININDLSTLKFENVAPIILTENINNKSVELSLEELYYNSVNHIGGISEINIDTFGRVTNVVTGSISPISGVIPGTYNPSISEITVNEFGVITSITANDLPAEITNERIRAMSAEAFLTVDLNYEISRATYTENALTTSLNNEIIRATASEISSNISITNETTRSISVEGLLSNLKTINKTSLVSAINEEITRASNNENTNATTIYNEISRAVFKEEELTNHLNTEITRATAMETTINTTLDIIGQLTDYSLGETLISNLGNLNSLVGNKTNLVEYINTIGNVDEYDPSSTLLMALGSLSNIPSGSSISEFILKYGEANLLTLATGRKTLLEIIGNELIIAKYSYGPSSLVYGGSFDRDGYFPLFTSINNLNTWKNTNVIAVLDAALTRVTNPGTEYTNIQNFKNSFIFDVGIGQGQTINHAWNVILSHESANQIYYTITHTSTTSNPSISFTNTSAIAETITIPLNNAGTFSNSIIGDIALLEGQVSVLNSSIGVSSSGSGAGADILGKLSALGDAPSFQTIMNSRTIVDVIGSLSTGTASEWFNKTILGTIGEPTNISDTTDITSELQNLGTLSDYSTNTLISKIGNISSISATLKDIVDAIGDITMTYNLGNTLLSNMYTRTQIDTQIANLINSAPGTLNTLNELAASLGNDANYSTTITNNLTNITNSISNVENTALSTWPGTANLNKLGIITTGIWRGTNLEINRIGWVNKINAAALQTDLPASSNDSLIARVVGDGLYFSDGVNYKRVSNYDDVVTLLSGKQTSITTGPLTNILAGPDFSTNKVVISGGAGKIDVSSVTSTQLSHLGGVTSPIQTQLNSKQATLSSGSIPLETISGITISLSQLNYITDVTGAIQMQLDSKQATLSSSSIPLETISGITMSLSELNQITGVTGPIQTQLDSKQAILSSSSIPLETISSITMSLSELNQITGVTSPIQTQLDSKQATLSSSSIPLETISGITMSLSELNYITGVTGSIQTQLDSKQATLSSSSIPLETISGITMSLSELNYITGVTGSIQGQLDNVNGNGYKIENQLTIDRNNITSSYKNNTYPIICDNSIDLSEQYQAWGVRTTGLNYSLPWRIIFKQQISYKHESETNFILGFNHDINDPEWDTGVGGDFNNNSISLIEAPATLGVNTFSLNNTTGIPSSYFDINTPTYTEITRLSGGETDIRLYNSTFTEIYYTQITTVLPYDKSMVFTMYYNRHRAMILGILFEQGNGITPYDLYKMSIMNNYVQSQIKNNVLSDYKTYFGGLLDYYVSLNTDGTIKLTGQQCEKMKIKFSLELNNSGIRTLYDDISTVSSPNLYIKDEDGVTWFKPPYESKPTDPAFYHKPALLLTGLDTADYDDFGFTVVFYLKNFTYRTGDFDCNIMALLTDDTVNSELIKSRIILFNSQYEYKISSSKNFNIESEANPVAPRYEWHNTSKFKNADIQYASPSTGVLIQNPEDVWFVAHTYKSGTLVNSVFGENVPNGEKVSQFFYKRTNIDKLNAGKIWKPVWTTGSDATWINGGLSKHFKKNSWLIFGATKPAIDSVYNELTIENWESYNIEYTADHTIPDVDISEIMIFNKALTYDELSKLSKLSPAEAKLLLS